MDIHSMSPKRTRKRFPEETAEPKRTGPKRAGKFPVAGSLMLATSKALSAREMMEVVLSKLAITLLVTGMTGSSLGSEALNELGKNVTDCSAFFIASVGINGSIESPGYQGDIGLPPKFIECEWIILGPYHHIVQLHFVQFDLPVPNTRGRCDRAYVQYGGYDHRHRRIIHNQICGVSPPPDYMTNLRFIWLKLVVTGLGGNTVQEHKGFHATYTAAVTLQYENELIVGVVCFLVVPLSCCGPLIHMWRKNVEKRHMTKYGYDRMIRLQVKSAIMKKFSIAETKLRSRSQSLTSILEKVGMRPSAKRKRDDSVKSASAYDLEQAAVYYGSSTKLFEQTYMTINDVIDQPVTEIIRGQGQGSGNPFLTVTDYTPSKPERKKLSSQSDGSMSPLFRRDLPPNSSSKHLAVRGHTSALTRHFCSTPTVLDREIPIFVVDSASDDGPPLKRSRVSSILQVPTLESISEGPNEDSTGSCSKGADSGAAGDETKVLDRFQAQVSPIAMIASRTTWNGGSNIPTPGVTTAMGFSDCSLVDNVFTPIAIAVESHFPERLQDSDLSDMQHFSAAQCTSDTQGDCSGASLFTYGKPQTDSCYHADLSSSIEKSRSEGHLTKDTFGLISPLCGIPDTISCNIAKSAPQLKDYPVHRKMFLDGSRDSHASSIPWATEEYQHRVSIPLASEEELDKLSLPWPLEDDVAPQVLTALEEEGNLFRASENTSVVHSPICHLELENSNAWSTYSNNTASWDFRTGHPAQDRWDGQEVVLDGSMQKLAAEATSPGAYFTRIVNKHRAQTQAQADKSADTEYTFEPSDFGSERTEMFVDDVDMSADEDAEEEIERADTAASERGSLQGTTLADTCSDVLRWTLSSSAQGGEDPEKSNATALAEQLELGLTESSFMAIYNTGAAFL